jgi:FtsH-binding integral membrane protein
MSRFPNFNATEPSAWQQTDTSNPAVVRFFNAVYAWMCAGLALTAVIAYFFSQYLQKQFVQGHQPFNMGLFIGLFVVEIILVGVIASAINRISAAAATGLFLLYAGLNGITLSGIFLVYAPSAIASAFIISAGTFGAMSVFGMLTQKDLTGMGRILFMALIGVIIASVVSMFWHNSMLQVAINYIGVFVFVGLTAYDTQKLKYIADQTSDNPAMAARMSIVGSLTLYLDFINLFLFILRILNQGRRN